MHPRSFYPVIVALILLACGLAAPVSAVGLIQDWKEVPYGTGLFSGVAFSSDNNVVYAGGNQMLLRTWTGDRRWGGKAGTIAAMSADGNYVISAVGDSVVMYDRDGIDLWTRNFDKRVRAVAIATNGSFVIEADDSGLVQSWARNGDFIGRNKTENVKSLKISRDGSLVVMATDAGLRFVTPALNPIWEDTKNGNWDELIAISADSSTVITAGGTRLSSHTPTGSLNWMKDITTTAITDMAASANCDVIVVGDQGGKVHLINRFGLERLSYPAGQWVNAVGVSGDGRLIAAASVERMLYVLDGNGNLAAQLKADNIIQPRSLAVSNDGRRIAFADQTNLLGFTVRQQPEITPERTRLPTIREPEPTVTATSVRETPREQPVQTTAPSPAPTKAGTGGFVALAGIVLALLGFRGRDH